MKLGVIADIHSNYHGFLPCVKKLEQERVDGIIFLGDYLTDFPNPQDTVRLIYKLKNEYPCFFVKGNREEYLCNYRKKREGWSYNSQTGSLLYTFEELNSSDLDFFDSMPVTDVVKLGNMKSIRICHGTPYEARGRMDESFERVAADFEEQYILFGHHHRPANRCEGGTHFFNPGAAGSPTDEIPKACFGILESQGRDWHCTAYRLDYSLENIIEDFNKSGLMEKAPMWARATICQARDGADHADFLLNEALKIAKGKALTEEHFVNAAKQLKIVEVDYGNGDCNP